MIVPEELRARARELRIAAATTEFVDIHEERLEMAGLLEQCADEIDDRANEATKRQAATTKCKHHEECEECWKTYATANRKQEIRSEMVTELGIGHLKGQRQLDVALAEIRRLKALEGSRPRRVISVGEGNPE
jgi:hypothetical protein